MSSIGEKIKEVFTGHHHRDDEQQQQQQQQHENSSASAATAAATTKPHDPEYDTKRATSEAGNYPYWHKEELANTTIKTPHGAIYPGLDTHKPMKEGLGGPAAAAGVGAGAGAGAAALGSGSRADSSSSPTKGSHRHVNEYHNHPHDAEKEAKEATSAAGNHPYWGNLPATGEQNAYQQHEQAVTTGTGGLQEATKAKDSRRDSGFATGAGVGAVGLGAAGLGYAAAKHHNEEKDKSKPVYSHEISTSQRDVPDRGREPGQGSFAQPDLLPSLEHKPATSTTSFPPKRNDNHDNLDKGLVAGGLGSSTLGGAYLASKHKRDAESAEKPAMSEVSSSPAQAGPGSLNKDYASQVSRSAAPRETPTMTNIMGASTGLASSSDKPENRDRDALGADSGRAFPLTQSDKPHNTLGSSSYGDSKTSSAPGATILDTGAGAAGVYSQSGNTNKLINTVDGSSSTPHDTGEHIAFGSSKKHEKELFDAGIGAAGLAGAGYLESKHDQDEKNVTADTKQPATLGDTTYHTTSPGQKRYEMPRTTGDTNTSTLSGTRTAPTLASLSSDSGGVHNTVIGAGSPEYQNTGTYPSTATDNSGSQNAMTAGPHEHEHISTSALGGSGRSLGRVAPHDNHDREKQALAAAAGVGAGAGVYGAERKHRRDEEEKQRGSLTGADTYSNTGSSSLQGLPSHPASTSTMPYSEQAHAAAQQAWKDNNQPSSATSGTPRDRHAGVAPGVAAPYGQGRAHDQNTRAGELEKIGEKDVGSHDKHHAPASFDEHRTSPSVSSSRYSNGAGDNVSGSEKHVGVEPGTAVYYGQGREHDQNPRSDESQKIAERALGLDGKAHAPESQSHDSSRTGHDQMASGRKMFSMPGSYPSASNTSGPLGGGNNKVIHKCHQCGAENDISDYLKNNL